MNAQPRISYFSQFLIFIGLVGAMFLVAGATALIIWQALVGGKLSDMEKGLTNPANADAVKLVQLVSSTIMFLLPALIFARVVHKDPIRYLGMKTKPNWKQAGLVLLMVLAGFYLSGALGELSYNIPLPADKQAWFKKLEKQYTDQVMAIANMQSISDYLYTLVVIALAPAIFEELVFRGVLQQIFVKSTNSAWFGIVLTAIIFSAIHFSFYGFLSRFALGVVLGYIYYYSNSIWLSILAHFINNGFAVTAMYVMSRKGKLSPESMDDRFPIWFAAAAAAIIVALFMAFVKESKRTGAYAIDNTYQKSDDPFDEEAARFPYGTQQQDPL